jgi:hypothetical protein
MVQRVAGGSAHLASPLIHSRQRHPDKAPKALPSLGKGEGGRVGPSICDALPSLLREEAGERIAQH